MKNPQVNIPTIPILAILGCCLIWGTTFTVVKDVSNSIDPFLLSGFRNLIATSALFVYFIITKKSKILLDKNSLRSGLVLGVLLGTIYISQTIGITFTSANHSAFITCSAVIMVPVILFLFGWEKFNKKQILSILMVAIGLILLTLKSGLSGFNLGDLITLVAAVICAMHIVFSGLYVRKYNFLSLIFYQFFFAGLVSFCGLFSKQAFYNFPPILFENDAIYNVLYLGLLGTLFCYFVTVWGQKHVSTTYIALIFSLEPLFASVTNYLVLNEVFTTKEFIGAVIIFGGILLYSIPKKWFSIFRNNLV
ncbi:EamA family transporter [Flavobacteriales bacterium]|nr:EamA family transporter [Flavobacteriales bacterium]